MCLFSHSDPGWRHGLAPPHAGEDLSPSADVAKCSQHYAASSRWSEPKGLQVYIYVQHSSHIISHWSYIAHNLVWVTDCVILDSTRPTLFMFLVQNAALWQTMPAERCEKHPGWRTPQQVLVPQHDGAQWARQEDWYHSGHSKYTATEERMQWSRSLYSDVPLILPSFHLQILDDLLEMDRVTAHFWEPHSHVSSTERSFYTETRDVFFFV